MYHLATLFATHETIFFGSTFFWQTVFLLTAFIAPDPAEEQNACNQLACVIGRHLVNLIYGIGKW
jgi:hypothetical protein